MVQKYRIVSIIFNFLSRSTKNPARNQQTPAIFTTTTTTLWITPRARKRRLPRESRRGRLVSFHYILADNSVSQLQIKITFKNFPSNFVHFDQISGWRKTSREPYVVVCRAWFGYKYFGDDFLGEESSRRNWRGSCLRFSLQGYCLMYMNFGSNEHDSNRNFSYSFIFYPQEKSGGQEHKRRKQNKRNKWGHEGFENHSTSSFVASFWHSFSHGLWFSFILVFLLKIFLSWCLRRRQAKQIPPLSLSSKSWKNATFSNFFFSFSIHSCKNWWNLNLCCKSRRYLSLWYHGEFFVPPKVESSRFIFHLKNFIIAFELKIWIVEHLHW